MEYGKNNCIFGFVAAALADRGANSSESGSIALGHGYIPLSQVTRLPTDEQNLDAIEAGPNAVRRLLVVNNRTYCVTFDSFPGEDDTGAVGTVARRILVQPMCPPTYEEVLAENENENADNEVRNAP